MIASWEGAVALVRSQSHLQNGLAAVLLFFALSLMGCESAEQTALETLTWGETARAVANPLREHRSPLDAQTATALTSDVGAASLSQQTEESAEHVRSSSIATLRLVRAPDGGALIVQVDNVRDLYAVDMRIRFDATERQVADADAQMSGVQIKPGEAPRPDFVAVNSVDNMQGIVRYVATQLGDAAAFNGGGTIATIFWQTGVDSGANALVEAVTLVNKHAQAIEVVVR